MAATDRQTHNGATFSRPSEVSRRKRILIVNCYFDVSHQVLRRRTKIPQAVGPIYLAGAFDRDSCEVFCYSELPSGPLEDERLFGWPDMLVLTGLTNSFDRMRHLTAYARTKNPRVIVVAGGPAVRALPRLSKRYFDYSCSGDIEELREVVIEAFGKACAADQMIPRYDLAYWLGKTGYVETTRNCNFRCSFCALSGEGRRYQNYDLEYIRRQVVAAGRRKRFVFLDNNFYGNSRQRFHDRIDLINELRSAGHFSNWGALVTNDFFRSDENLTRVRESGCELLFSGVESFDPQWLRSVNKLQNAPAQQMQVIENCLRAGIVFTYGLILDVTTRRVADLRRELDFIVGSPEIPLPSFTSMAIPLLGTPYFFDGLKNGTILPSTKLRDMDGTTLTQRTLDPLDQVVGFLSDLRSLSGYRSRLLKHSFQFARRYRSSLTPLQMAIAVSGGLITSASKALLWYEGGSSRAARRRTFVSSSEPLGPTYTPAFPVDSRFEHYFRPTMVTDEHGDLHPDLIESGLLEPPMPHKLEASL